MKSYRKTTINPNFFGEWKRRDGNFSAPALIISDKRNFFVVLAWAGVVLGAFPAGRAVALSLVVFLIWQYWSTKMKAKGLSIERQFFQHGREKESFVITYRISNESPFGHYNLVISDSHELTQKGESIFSVSRLSRFGSKVIKSELVLDNGMGKKSFQKMKILLEDSWGIYRFLLEFERESDSIEVFPYIENVPELTAKGDRASQRMGFFEEMGRGDSINFIGIREYVRGDPVKRINWKRSMRLHQMVINEFEKNVNAHIHLCLNLDIALHAGSGAVSTWEVAKDVALSILYNQIPKGNTVSMTTGEIQFPIGIGQRYLNLIELTIGGLLPKAMEGRNFVWKSLERISPGAINYFIIPSLASKYWNGYLDDLVKAGSMNRDIRVILVNPVGVFSFHNDPKNKIYLETMAKTSAQQLLKIEARLKKCGTPYAVVNVFEKTAIENDIRRSRSYLERKL